MQLYGRVIAVEDLSNSRGVLDGSQRLTAHQHGRAMNKGVRSSGPSEGRKPARAREIP